MGLIGQGGRGSQDLLLPAGRLWVKMKRGPCAPGQKIKAGLWPNWIQRSLNSGVESRVGRGSGRRNMGNMLLIRI